MASPVPLRSDLDDVQLRGLAKRSRDPDQIRRLLALAAIYEGGSRSDAARIGGVGLQTVRDWVLSFNAEGPAGLLNGKAPGRSFILDDLRDWWGDRAQAGRLPPKGFPKSGRFGPKF